MEFKEGAFYDKDFIAPSYINLNNPKYMEIDEIYYSTLIGVNYYREQSDLILKNIINAITFIYFYLIDFLESSLLLVLKTLLYNHLKK